MLSWMLLSHSQSCDNNFPFSCDLGKGNSRLLPPILLKDQQANWNNYFVCQLHASKTFKDFFPEKQQQWLTCGKFSVSFWDGFRQKCRAKI